MRSSGKQSQCPGMSGLFVKSLDELALGRSLERADLAQIQHVAPHHAAALDAPVLDDAPVEMRLSVLPSFGLSQEHGGDDFATDARVGESPSRLVGLHYSRFWRWLLNNPAILNAY